MSTTWSLYVEGKTDKALIECLLRSRRIAHIEVKAIHGGVSKLPSVAIDVQRSSDIGRAIAMIFDADSNPGERRSEYESQVRTLDLNVDRVFFLPDDESSGCLEDLLQRIALPEHLVVYECFGQYEQCLRGNNGAYQLPSLKGRVYAYCEAVGGVKEKKRRGDPVIAACQNASYWNVDAEALQPLMAFLDSLEGSEGSQT